MWIAALASMLFLTCIAFLLLRLATGSDKRALIGLSGLLALFMAIAAVKYFLAANPVHGGEDNPSCSGSDCAPANPGAAQ